MSDEIVIFPRTMPEWARERERQIRKEMHELHCEYNQRAEPLVKELVDLYHMFPEPTMIIKNDRRAS